MTKYNLYLTAKKIHPYYQAFVMFLTIVFVLAELGAYYTPNYYELITTVLEQFNPSTIFEIDPAHPTDYVH